MALVSKIVVQCRHMSSAYGDTSTTRAFGGTSQFCGPESPIGKASPHRDYCVDELLHFNVKQGPIHSSECFFEKGFRALSRPQVFGKADFFSPFKPVPGLVHGRLRFR